MSARIREPKTSTACIMTRKEWLSTAPRTWTTTRSSPNIRTRRRPLPEESQPFGANSRSRFFALRQRHHPAPELLTLAGVNVVFAHEGEPAVVADAIDHDAGGERLDLVAFAHGQRADARRDQQPPARIDAEGAQVDALAVDGLDQLRLTAPPVDGEHRDIVLAAVEHLLALELDLALVAVDEIDEAAVGMDVDRAGALRRLDVDGIGERLLDERRVAAERAVRRQPVDIELVLPLDRDEHPRLARVEIEMPRPEAEPAAGRDRGEVGQRAVLEAVDLERAGILGLAAGGVVAARDQDRGAVSRCGKDLVRVDAGVGLARLRDLIADRAVPADAVHRDIARRIVGGQEIFAARVDAGVDRP